MLFYADRWCLPRNKGQMFHARIIPRDVNWPRATSSKNSGIPAKKTLTKYGIRKAPITKDSEIEIQLKPHSDCKFWKLFAIVCWNTVKRFDNTIKFFDFRLTVYFEVNVQMGRRLFQKVPHFFPSLWLQICYWIYFWASFVTLLEFPVHAVVLGFALMI